MPWDEVFGTSLLDPDGTWDPGGDGLSARDELFGILTNPLVLDTEGGAVSKGEEPLA